MVRLTKKMVEEYKYDSEEERTNHIIEMEKLGFECDGQARKTDDNLMVNREPEYYWFGRFYKYE